MSRVRVYRHPDCAKCARYAAMHRRLDWLRRVEDSTRPPPDGPVAMGEVRVQDLRSGVVHHGADGMALLARQVPAYWPMLPLFAIPAFRRRIDAETAGACGSERAAEGRRRP